MAKIKAPLPGAHRLHLRRTFYVRQWRGLLIAQACPLRPKRTRNPRIKAAQRAMRDATRAWRYQDPQTLAAYVRAFRNTQVLPRDAFTSMLYGTLIAFPTPDGRTLWPHRLATLVSRALDALAAEPGALPVRAAQSWQALRPGPRGALLRSQGPAAPPVWL